MSSFLQVVLSYYHENNYTIYEVTFVPISVRKMDNAEVLNWSSNQGNIINGGGILNDCFADFDKTMLPHFLLSTRSTWKTFGNWIKNNKRSHIINGAWKRPIFCGGWSESGSHDTIAFNLQTPSLFVDMRFPTDRPTHLHFLSGIDACSNNDLKFLARQHCFAGYSYPEAPYPTTRLNSDGIRGPLFTRHHIIDWNYHPKFPRPRPNQWWVQVSPDGESFKEFSAAREITTNIPVYFERWQRYDDDSKGKKYLAVRRKPAECPHEAHAAGRVADRDAVFIVVGDHFALANNRCSAPFPSFELAASSNKKVIRGPGGPSLVDQALADGLTVAQLEEGRDDAEAYLDLEGSYGRVSDGWKIVQSTHPWKEGSRMVDMNTESTADGGEFFSLEQPITVAAVTSNKDNCTRGRVHIKWANTSSATGCGSPAGEAGSFAIVEFNWGGNSWEVAECSFSINELQAMFGDSSCEYVKTPVLQLRSRL